MQNRLLLFSDEFPPDGGGAGVVAQQLALDLQAHNIDVTLLVGATKRTRIYDHKISEVRRPTLVWPLMYFAEIISLRIKSFDRIILNDYVSAYVAGLFFDKLVLNRSIILVHGEDAEFFLKRDSLKHRIFQYRRCYERALRHCRCVIASSKYARDEFIDHINGIIDPSKVHYAYMGINPSTMGSPSVFLKSDLGIRENAILLFTACRLVEEKGLLVMLEHFREAAAVESSLHWIIAGDGPLRSTLEQRIEQYYLQTRITLLGRLDRKAMANYYSLADVFWLLSRRNAETFGLVYIEAAHYGTPCIGLRYAGVPEAISEGHSGYFLDDNCSLLDTIHRCLALDRDECKRFSTGFLSDTFARRLSEA